MEGCTFCVDALQTWEHCVHAALFIVSNKNDCDAFFCTRFPFSHRHCNFRIHSFLAMVYLEDIARPTRKVKGDANFWDRAILVLECQFLSRWSILKWSPDQHAKKTTKCFVSLWIVHSGKQLQLFSDRFWIVLDPSGIIFGLASNGFGSFGNHFRAAFG